MQTWDPYEAISWGSHLPVLAGCVARCPGPVLEIGCGDYSTPTLHAIVGAAAGSRRMVTVEKQEAWLEKFADYRCEWHRLERQTEEVLEELAGRRGGWGVVFVDENPGEETRVRRLAAFASEADYVVLHDYSHPPIRSELDEWLAGPGLHYHRAEYGRYTPTTLVVSLLDRLEWVR